MEFLEKLVEREELEALKHLFIQKREELLKDIEKTERMEKILANECHRTICEIEGKLFLTAPVYSEHTVFGCPKGKPVGYCHTHPIGEAIVPSLPDIAMGVQLKLKYLVVYGISPVAGKAVLRCWKPTEEVLKKIAEIEGKYSLLFLAGKLALANRKIEEETLKVCPPLFEIELVF